MNQAASWQNCPDLSLPDNAKEIKCDAATCMSICAKNFVAEGIDLILFMFLRAAPNSAVKLYFEIIPRSA